MKNMLCNGLLLALLLALLIIIGGIWIFVNGGVL